MPGFVPGPACGLVSWLLWVRYRAPPETLLFSPPQGLPGLKGEQGDTVVIDYDGRILDALKVVLPENRMPSPFVSGGSNHLLCTFIPHLLTHATRDRLAPRPQLCQVLCWDQTRC